MQFFLQNTKRGEQIMNANQVTQNLVERNLGICPWKMSILNFGFDFPIVRSKIKIDVHRRVTYQKRRENVQKPSENTTFPKYGNFGWFSGVVSLLVTQINLILFPLDFYCSPDMFWYVTLWDGCRDQKLPKSRHCLD